MPESKPCGKSTRIGTAAGDPCRVAQIRILLADKRNKGSVVGQCLIDSQILQIGNGKIRNRITRAIVSVGMGRLDHIGKDAAHTPMLDNDDCGIQRFGPFRYQPVLDEFKQVVQIGFTSKNIKHGSASLEIIPINGVRLLKSCR
jgi:hypothetical protein